MHRSNEAMNSIGNFPKKYIITIVSIEKPKNIIVFAFKYVFCPVLWRFLHGFI
jgi:hypothetical protein